MVNFLFRVVFFALGLIFAASLTVAALLLACVWMVRVAWGKLTGKPVTPWSVMFGDRFDPRQGFERFRAAAERQREPTAADVVAARARGESAQSPVGQLGRGARPEVTDVQARPVDKEP